MAPPKVEQDKLFIYDPGHNGFWVILTLWLILIKRFCEVDHPDAQVRECGDQVDVESEENSSRTGVLQTPGADFSLHMWGCSFHTNGESPYPRRLTSGEKSLVYFSVPM